MDFRYGEPLKMPNRQVYTPKGVREATDEEEALIRADETPDKLDKLLDTLEQKNIISKTERDQIIE